MRQDPAAADPEVADLVDVLARVDDPAAADLNRPQGKSPSLALADRWSRSPILAIQADPRLAPAAEQVEHGHPHGQAIGHLVEDRRVRAVGDLRGQLDAAVDRPGRQEEQVVLGHAAAAPGSSCRTASTRRPTGNRPPCCRSNWMRRTLTTSHRGRTSSR